MDWLPIRQRRLRARLWWWLAPTYARPELRHDVAWWRLRQINLDLAALWVPYREALDRMGTAIGDFATNLGAALLPALRAASDSITSFAAAWEGAKLHAQDDRPAHDGPPPERLW